MQQTELIRFLKEYVTPERWEKMNTVLENRTRHLTVVLEDIFQPHNASAVLRSCDACGIQDVHLIENRNSHTLSRGVELGTSQWLTRYRYRERDDNTAAAIAELRQRGYRIVATTPHRDDVIPASFDLERGPAALLFGTELTGLSEVALAEADEYMRIPMYGFVESYNISVSAAIILSQLREKLNRSGIAWGLTPPERETLLLQYLRGSIKQVEKLEKRLLSDYTDR